MRGFLSPATLEALGAESYSYPFSFTVPAASGGAPGQISTPISIQGEKPFFSETLRMQYPTTVLDDEDAVIDDGVCRLTVQLKLNTSLQVFDTDCRLSLIAVPGRQTVAGVLNAAGEVPEFGQAPQVDGIFFPLYHSPGSKFIHVFRNSSDVEAVVDVCWQGYNLSGDFDTPEKFWRVVRASEERYGRNGQEPARGY